MHYTDIKHVTVTFQDQISGAKLEKTITVNLDIYEKMKAGIGSVVHRFENNINWQLEVISVEPLFAQANSAIPGEVYQNNTDEYFESANKFTVCIHPGERVKVLYRVDNGFVVESLDYQGEFINEARCILSDKTFCLLNKI